MDFSLITIEQLEVFNTIFTSILLQAFPFMLIGVLVSSAMHVFIPDEWIVKIFPTKNGLGFLTALIAGLFFPVCECAIVPLMTRLVKKGVSVPIAITFMLFAPIINPIVLISTFYAFPGQPEIVLYRVLFGLIISVSVGLVLTLSGNKLSMLKDESPFNVLCSCGHHHMPHEHVHEKNSIHILIRIKTMLLHAGDEFFGVGKYLVIGAFITGVIQTWMPKNILEAMGSHPSLSLMAMMMAAFLFSACSTSDAFIARSFVGNFSTGSIMGFLVFGPMMDIKNLLMLLGNFKKGFVMRLTLVIIAVNFVLLSILTHLLM